MNIQTVSYLKENANNLSLDGPLHVTQNGKEVYVVLIFWCVFIILSLVNLFTAKEIDLI